jgi:hypothetical protein
MCYQGHRSDAVIASICFQDDAGAVNAIRAYLWCAAVLISKIGVHVGGLCVAPFFALAASSGDPSARARPAQVAKR